jgi:hypothetical protein
MSLHTNERIDLMGDPRSIGQNGFGAYKVPETIEDDDIEAINKIRVRSLGSMAVISDAPDQK